MRLPRIWLGLALVMVAASMPIRAEAFEAGQTLNSWQVYFSPEGGCTQAIVDAIKGAKQQVVVQAYEMTSPRIKSALVAAHKRGIQVKAIFDPEATSVTRSMVSELSAGGIPVFIDNFHRPGLAHNKVMVIDHIVVITGSFNFTKAAETRNAENLLVIHDPALAAAYEHNFAAHLAHSSAPGAADITAPRRTYHRRLYYPHFYRHKYW